MVAASMPCASAHSGTMDCRRDGHAEQQQVGRQEGTQQGDCIEDTRSDQSPLLADPGSQRPGGQITQQLGQTDQGATKKAATPTLAPRSRADSATSGRIAPWPSETSRVGPYAGMAMSRSRVGVGSGRPPPPVVTLGNLPTGSDG